MDEREYVGGHYVVVQMVEAESMTGSGKNQVFEDRTTPIQNEEVAVAVTESLKDLIDAESEHRVINVTQTLRTNNENYSPHTFSSQNNQAAKAA